MDAARRLRGSVVTKRASGCARTWRALQAFAGFASLAVAIGAAVAPDSARAESVARGRKRAAPPPLDGSSHDYAYDGRDVGPPARAWLGRAFVHARAAADPKKPLPLLVFLHGLNTDRIKYRWMGGGNEGDVRRIVAELIESGAVPPLLVAAPSTIVPEAAFNAVTSWPGFDLDHFVERTAEALHGIATIDRDRVIVAGHSGAGCNATGGIATAARAKHVRAVLAIDTCMLPAVAVPLARAHPTTDVIVSWQRMTWAKRPIADFQKRFASERAAAPPATALRVLEELRPKEPMPHDAMVPLVLRTWLPKLLAPAAPPPAPSPSPPPASASPSPPPVGTAPGPAPAR